MTVSVTRYHGTATDSGALSTGRQSCSSRTRTRGTSLIEMIVAMMVMGVMYAMGVPRFQQSLEQARANTAGANLQAIWSAQRLYWLENRTYASDLPTLLAANPSSPLIDPSLTTTTAPYTYSVTDASESGFTATATRSSSSSGWSGAFTLIADGTLSGTLTQTGQSNTIMPGFQ